MYYTAQLICCGLSSVTFLNKVYIVKTFLNEYLLLRQSNLTGEQKAQHFKWSK